MKQLTIARQAPAVRRLTTNVLLFATDGTPVARYYYEYRWS